MTNNEKFNAFINSCCHPRLVLNALRALAIASATSPEKEECNNDRLDCR